MSGGLDPAVANALKDFRHEGEKVAQTKVDEVVVKLMQSSKTGKLKLVKKVLGKMTEEQVRERDGAGRTALHFGVLSGKTDVVEALVEAGVPVDVADFDGFTPFLLAVKHGKQDVASTLLELGADANVKTERGGTALHEAAGNGDTAMIEWLMADDRMDVPSVVNAASQIGTPLGWAAGEQHLEACRLLLETAGADPDMADGSGIRPLHYAAMHSNVAMVQLFLEEDADANARLQGGVTALHMAADCGSLAIAELLVNAGALLFRDADRDSPLDLAIRASNTEMIELLRGLEYGEDDGTTAGDATNQQVDVFKQAGNTAFGRREYQLAVNMYTYGLEIDADNGILYSNRSAAHYNMEAYEDALADAEEAVRLRPEWGRAFLRKVMALIKLNRVDDAEEAAAQGEQADPECSDMRVARLALDQVRGDGDAEGDDNGTNK